MMKGWSLALILLLSACSSAPQKVYYQIPVDVKDSAVSITPASGHYLEIRTVNLADYLSNSGIVFQTSDVRYTIASNNLWASPLDQQLRQALMVTLHDGLPGWRITSQDIGGNPAMLDVNVTAFQGRYDGKAVINGEWILRYQDKVVTHPFHIEIPQTADGYDALVKALSQGWLQVGHSIVQQMASFP
ncbi:hypothetical protein CWC46_12040 [Prodigiosinella confusarubida]|uniref:ABC-type transport auxiliary lipoprotein component domain-containing protein n=1 Tax=Serratia sp. (strain ATCC 39006) TaxID=104623 RepID=A0A2I5T7G0_SERS3|nr:membrane integrity-associated transporter subunit PqiC [Serratia sp. ATCC 39006]AUH00474.1 hypothetical protein CWC46_12040 [Serratia sp. ATCC 39006]AUH04794.1 hypothetical protein Ser39006_012045 [Serratia sp. ATCC 39006]